jgi:hypothetical protein
MRPDFLAVFFTDFVSLVPVLFFVLSELFLSLAFAMIVS